MNRTPTVSARERARQVMARKRAAEVEREKAIEESLAIVLATADAEQRAAVRRRDAIAAAHTAYDNTMAELNRRSGHALQRMRALDEPIASIGAITGLSRQRITELIRLAAAETVARIDGSPVATTPPIASSVGEGRVEHGQEAAVKQPSSRTEPVAATG